jgi:hypothetical protein
VINVVEFFLQLHTIIFLKSYLLIFTLAGFDLTILNLLFPQKVTIPLDHVARVAAYFLVDSTKGRCYDHNFRRFLLIFGEITAFFSKTNVMIIFLQKATVVWTKNAYIFAKFF